MANSKTLALLPVDNAAALVFSRVRRDVHRDMRKLHTLERSTVLQLTLGAACYSSDTIDNQAVTAAAVKQFTTALELFDKGLAKLKQLLGELRCTEQSQQRGEYSTEGATSAAAMAAPLHANYHRLAELVEEYASGARRRRLDEVCTDLKRQARAQSDAYLGRRKALHDCDACCEKLAAYSGSVFELALELDRILDKTLVMRLANASMLRRAAAELSHGTHSLLDAFHEACTSATAGTAWLGMAAGDRTESGTLERLSESVMQKHGLFSDENGDAADAEFTACTQSCIRMLSELDSSDAQLGVDLCWRIAATHETMCTTLEAQCCALSDLVQELEADQRRQRRGIADGLRPVTSIIADASARISSCDKALLLLRDTCESLGDSSSGENIEH